MFRYFCCKPVLAAALFSLASCASVNPIGLAKLAAMDPLTADPAQLAVAARLPEALKLRTGNLVMTVKTDDTKGADMIDETFLLDVKDAKGGEAGVIMPETGERLQTARVASADIDRLRATQARARVIKTAGGEKGKGSISIFVRGACRTGDLPAGPLNLNVFMATETGGSWFPVVSNLDVRKALGADVLAKIEACG
jgi:hypothetical protein